MAAELPRLQKQILLGVVVLAAMLALNSFLFGGAGAIVLLAPIGWIMFGGYRYRTLKVCLRRRTHT